MKGFGGGMANMMKQANQMQMRMKKMQEELAKKEFSGSAGGGVVQLTINGEYLVQNIKIDKEVLQTGDNEMLQDLVAVAMNEAVKTAKDLSAQEMQKITGGLSIPGLF